jgi:putative transposase
MMARPLRICIAGGVYHVIARGNAREPIFLDDDDRSAFLATIAHVVHRCEWLCHGYCLMDNHYHLVIETARANLPIGMRQLNGRYAQRFNRRHDRTGHLFEARYRSILVEKETHLLAVCRYVVLNAVRAGICADVGHYRWSSYLATAGLERPEPFLSTDWILRQFAETRSAAQTRYRDFVAAEAVRDLEEKVCGERLGSERFLRDRLGFDPPIAEIPRAQVEPHRPALAEIFGAEEAPIATAHRRYDYPLREIAEYLGCHYSTVSRRLERETAMRQRKT